MSFNCRKRVVLKVSANTVATKWLSVNTQKDGTKAITAEKQTTAKTRRQHFDSACKE